MMRCFSSLVILGLLTINLHLHGEESVGRIKYDNTNGSNLLAESKNTIAIMTYNIQQLGYANWMANHFEKERLALIPETILALEPAPDVLVLQEVFTENSFEFLTTELAISYPYHTEVVGQDCESADWTSVAGNCQKNTWKGNGGVFILSRWPIEEKHAYIYQAGRISKTFDFLAQKGVVYASISVVGQGRTQQIHVLGTHLQADSESHDIRMLQLKEMRRWFDKFEVAKSEAVILAGDFNVSSNDPLKFAELLKQTRSRLVFSEGAIGSKSPSTNRYLNMISSSKIEKTLDFILYRTDHLIPDIEPTLGVMNFKSAGPWQGQRLFSDPVEMNDLSDHYPTFMLLEYRR